jgi:hypothetical protein
MLCLDESKRASSLERLIAILLATQLFAMQVSAMQVSAMQVSAMQVSAMQVPAIQVPAIQVTLFCPVRATFARRPDSLLGCKDIRHDFFRIGVLIGTLNLGKELKQAATRYVLL